MRVTDNDGAKDTSTVTLTVTNALPIASLVLSANPATAGVPVTLDASGSTDPDGTIVRYDWDLDGNGTFETTTGAIATVSYAYPNAGATTVRVRVTDDSGATAMKTATLTIQSPPETGGGATTGGTSTTGGAGGTGTAAGAGSEPAADAPADTAPVAGGGDGGGSTVPGGPFSAGLIGAPIQALKLARTRGIGLTCTTDRRATCAIIAEISASEARRLKLVTGKRTKAKSRPLKVGSARVTALPGAGTRVVLRLDARVKRALKRTRRAQLVVRGTATDGAGGKIALVRIVLLRR